MITAAASDRRRPGRNRRVAPIVLFLRSRAAGFFLLSQTRRRYRGGHRSPRHIEQIDGRKQHLRGRDELVPVGRAYSARERGTDRVRFDVAHIPDAWRAAGAARPVCRRDDPRRVAAGAGGVAARFRSRGASEKRSAPEAATRSSGPGAPVGALVARVVTGRVRRAWRAARRSTGVGGRNGGAGRLNGSRAPVACDGARWRRRNGRGARACPPGRKCFGVPAPR